MDIIPTRLSHIVPTYTDLKAVEEQDFTLILILARIVMRSLVKMKMATKKPKMNWKTTARVLPSYRRTFYAPLKDNKVVGFYWIVSPLSKFSPTRNYVHKSGMQFIDSIL